MGITPRVALVGLKKEEYMNPGRKKRLLYAASRRSKLEAEELLLPFVKSVLDGLDEEGLGELDALLDMDDIALLEAFSGTAPGPPGAENMLQRLREFWRG